MLTNWKLWVVAACVFIALVASIIAYTYYEKVKHQEDSAKLSSASKANFVVVPEKVFVDTSGHSHYLVKANSNVFSQSTVHNSTASLGGADTAALALGIQRDQIESWKQYAMRSDARALRAERSLDSAGKVIRTYKDNYRMITYHEPTAVNGAGTFDYSGTDTLKALQYWKPRFKLLPFIAKNSYIDVSNSDKRTKVTGIESFEIKPNPSIFQGFKAQLRASYDFASGRMVPAAGVEFSLGNFDVAGRYYYSNHYQKFEPIVSAAYNFINIK